MMLVRNVVVCVIALAAASATGAAAADLPAAAGASSGVGVRLGGVVRTICRVEFERPAAAVSGPVVDFGAADELCNDTEGYRVVLRHDPALAGATFTIGGQDVILSSSGETVLVDTDGPRARRLAARLDLGERAVEFSNLSFRTEVKGASY